MAVSHTPTFTNLFFSVTDLIWLINDTFNSSLHTWAVPPWLHSLWSEIEQLQSLLEEAERYGLEADQLRHNVAAERSRLVLDAVRSVQELMDWMGSFRNGPVHPNDVLSLDKVTCNRYIEALKPCRIFIADALALIQS